MSHSFASFATLDEAWGGIGPVQPPPTCVQPQPQRSSETVPAPSDVDFSRCGAPIMDDIVNLYTPANTPTCRDGPPGASPSPPSPPSSAVQPSPSPAFAPAVQKRIRLGSGDDYSDSDDEVTEAKTSQRPKPRRRPASATTDTTAGIELAAYVLSGVMLIFLFESFITLGGHLRSGMSMTPY